jgi:hypothetical protein
MGSFIPAPMAMLSMSLLSWMKQPCSKRYFSMSIGTKRQKRPVFVCVFRRGSTELYSASLRVNLCFCACKRVPLCTHASDDSRERTKRKGIPIVSRADAFFGMGLFWNDGSSLPVLLCLKEYVDMFYHQPKPLVSFSFPISYTYRTHCYLSSFFSLSIASTNSFDHKNYFTWPWTASHPVPR